jgi:hypothetical protein
MADRVATGRIIHGHGNERITIMPGERFNTDTISLTEDQVVKLERDGVLRRPRDENTQAALPIGPAETTEEDRSGAAANARSPEAVEEEVSKPARRSRKAEEDL